jgi:hypothetical protein
MIEVKASGRTEEFRDPYQAAMWLLEQCSSSDLKCLDGALPKIKSYVAGAEVAERVAKGLPPIPEAA